MPGSRSRLIGSALECRHRVDQLAHGVGRALQIGLLGLGELDLDDLLDAILAELHRHADEQAVDAVFALAQGRAGSTRFWSCRIESTISTTAADGA